MTSLSENKNSLQYKNPKKKKMQTIQIQSSLKPLVKVLMVGQEEE